MKYIPYARQHIFSEDINAVRVALDAEYITQGPKVVEFEKALAGYCGAKYAVAVTSGTAALHIACLAAGIGFGQEVITSPISFAASSNCILYCGAVPRFADILGDTATIDSASASKLLNSRTKAIIPVDFAGHPAELEQVKKVALKRNLIVIEDAAHTLGAEYKGARTGCCKYSDMTVLSFHAVKHITTGEGGMVLTNRKDLYDKLVMLRNHGITRNKALMAGSDKADWFYEMQLLGFNYRITDIQCALGLSQLKKIDSFIQRRRAISRLYKEEFGNTSDIVCLAERGYAKSSWHIFPIRVKHKRDAVFNKLKAKGIGVNVHYIPIYLHPYYRDLGYKKGLCPEAEVYYGESLTLPLYSGMSDAEVRIVSSLVKDAVCKKI